jgi:cytoskeletal protein CcmA (bactofilin family)
MPRTDIDAGVAMLSGKINAEVKTSKRVELCSPAHFRGNILTPSLKVQEGVIFEGSTKMLNPY